ncbi:MAG TPA: hypothetical protein VMD07_03250 [Candidatus Acidoferrales bacterium]|nr:hypothetical protein [Candidatus Acidoferrales bacterium]
MSVAEELFDRWQATKARSLIVIGTAKNVGKTTTVTSLLQVADVRGLRVGLTSIGRDGEAFDAVDEAPKPRIFVEAGTIVAAGRALMPHARTIEVLDEHERSALGPIVFYRTNVPQYVEISGAPTARGMRAVIERLLHLGVDRVIVDGAIDRVAVVATGTYPLFVATGMALATTIDGVAEATQRFIASGRLGASQVLACTTCPVGEGRSVDATALGEAVARATGLVCYDVQAGLRWIP